MPYDDRLASTPARERWQASAYAMVLVAVNANISYRLFRVAGAHMNSMHGFWVSVAQRIGGAGFIPRGGLIGMKASRSSSPTRRWFRR